MLAVVAMTVLSACGRGDAVSGNTAARVGDERVSRSTVVGAVDRALAGTTDVSRAQLTKEHLTTQVKLALYRAEAKTLNVTITDDQLKATRAAFEEQTAAQGGLEKAAATSGIAKPDIEDVMRLVTFEQVLGVRLVKDAPVTDAELDVLRASNPAAFADQAHAAHILVADEALANRLLAEIKAGGDFAALAAKNSIDTGSKDKGGDLGLQPKGTFVPAFDAALFGGKAGDVVGPVKTEFGYHIIKVIELRNFADIKEQVRVSAGPTVGRGRLRALVGKGTEVRLNPRFGRWNAESLTVESPDDGVDADDPSAPSPAPSLGGGVPDAPASAPERTPADPSPSQQ